MQKYNEVKCSLVQFGHWCRFVITWTYESLNERKTISANNMRSGPRSHYLHQLCKLKGGKNQYCSCKPSIASDSKPGLNCAIHRNDTLFPRTALNKKTKQKNLRFLFYFTKMFWGNLTHFENGTFGTGFQFRQTNKSTRLLWTRRNSIQQLTNWTIYKTWSSPVWQKTRSNQPDPSLAAPGQRVRADLLPFFRSRDSVPLFRP